MKVGKPKSKRVSVRLRHKIEKKSAAKQRKDRKAAKTNPQWKSRLKKDPGIPNLFPYKAKVLAEIEEQKRRKEEEIVQRRELAKARREGRSVDATVSAAADDMDEDDVEEEDGGVNVIYEDDNDMDVDNSNPMAALLASAQARAHNFGTVDGGGDLEEDDDEDEDDDDEDVDEQWSGVDDKKRPTSQSEKKALPKKALEDPVKAVSLLIAKLEDTMGGVEALLAHYQLPPLITAGSDAHTRFLVDVARKRGRLGRGGIPNLHAAALIVLTDLHEERLQLPTSAPPTTNEPATVERSTIVKTMATPFKLDGLWGDT